jgi:hypothetical protein
MPPMVSMQTRTWGARRNPWRRRKRIGCWWVILKMDDTEEGGSKHRRGGGELGSRLKVDERLREEGWVGEGVLNFEYYVKSKE